MASMPDKILIFGATSAIAFETAKLFAKEGASFYLCARKEEELKRLSGDLKIRGAKEVAYSTFDALDLDSIKRVIEKCIEKFPSLDGLLIAHGLLPNQELCESDFNEMRKSFDINFTSVTAILNYMVPHFERQGHGTIAVISSIAGDRGRQKNYVYGAAKAAISVFLSGLRQRLHSTGVRIITIKPGFVDTPMTADFEKNFLFVGPEAIARGIYRAIKQGKDMVYLPWFWKWIMFIIKSIPEKVFKKLNF